MGQYVQILSFNKGDYFSHNSKAYYRSPNGKISLVTGDAMDDVELSSGQAARLAGRA